MTVCVKTDADIDKATMGVNEALRKAHTTSWRIYIARNQVHGSPHSEMYEAARHYPQTTPEELLMPDT